MKTICVAPFDATCRVFITEQNNFGVVSRVAVPPAYDNCKDASELFAGAKTGIGVCGDYEACVDECDAVLATNCSPECQEYLRQVLGYAIGQQKEIYYCHPERAILSQIVRGESYRGIHFSSEPLSFDHVAEWAKEGYSASLCPSIHIAALCSGLDTFELLCHMNNMLRREGISALSMSESPYCDLFGLRRILLSPASEDRIIEINSCAQDLINQVHPTLMIVEHPQPIISYSEYVHYDFGLSSHALFRALPPDVVICCLPVNLATPDFINTCSVEISYECGVQDCIFVVGNQMIDDSNQVELHSLGVCYAESSNAADRAAFLRGLGIPAYSLCSEIEAQVFDAWLEKLADGWKGWTFDE